MREGTHINSKVFFGLAVILSICWEILFDEFVDSREVSVLRESLIISALFIGMDFCR